MKTFLITTLIVEFILVLTWFSFAIYLDLSILGVL
jgi:hypothetical protein